MYNRYILLLAYKASIAGTSDQKTVPAVYFRKIYPFAKKNRRSCFLHFC
ncbi:hypothetical protein HMPREF1548_03537 [Clostridium sp. KLE 1755]|nr:hypothetical protein HMPREF1548_03537 [Clostridium sp. KLE 1755]